MKERVLGELAGRISPRILEAPARLDAVRRELDEFFSGRRRRFDVPLDLRLVVGFARRVLRATAAIPYGAVSSYKEVAEEAGSPRAYRAAGTALGSNPLPIVIPCHRVLHADGGLGDIRRARAQADPALDRIGSARRITVGGDGELE